MTPDALCQRCQLCCNGSLFTTTPLRGDDAARAESFSLTVLRRPNGSSVLEQPCKALCGASGCRIYAHRPQVCRDFDCRLRIALRDHEVSVEEAAQIVDGALALIAELQSHGAEEGAPLSQVRRALAREESVSDACRVAWERAERYLDRHFRTRRG